MIDHLNPNFNDIPGRRPNNGRYSLAYGAHISQPDVSVVMPFYNTEPLFEDTIGSLLGQTLQNWELIVVDDGSTDIEAIDMLDRQATKHPRIRVIRQENSGPSAARNAAAKNASGRYLCILDSDDLIEPTYLEKCVWFLDSNPEFAFCNSYSVVFGEQQYLWTTGFERNVSHLQANSGPPISVIRREAYELCGGFDESIRFGHEDWDFWLSLARVGQWGYTIPEFLQWYRKRGNGRFEEIMRDKHANALFEQLMRDRYKGLDQNFPKPQRRHPQPFETLLSQAQLTNPLQQNHHGRRILFIIPWMVTGGADRVNLDLIEGLTSQGHQVTVCATLSAEHQWEHLFTKLTPDVFVLPNFLHAGDYPRFFSYLIDSRTIDTVLISGSTIGYQLLPYLRTHAPDTAFLDLCHVEEPHWLNGGHPRFGAGYQDALDLNIVTTAHLAAWMTGRGADKSRIRVMYTGIKSQSLAISVDQRVERKRALGIEANSPVIVFAGRICEQKRPNKLAEILGAARDSGLDFHAVIIGDGPLRHQFEAAISQLQLSGCVKMLGLQPHERWLEILEISDILLLPSQYEGISIALLEAMAAGVVPVISDVGGQNEIVDDTTGHLIPHSPDEIDEYVFALKHLLGNKELVQQKSFQCRALISGRLSWSRTTEELEEIIEQAHRERITRPAMTISKGLAQEFAQMALEYKRLSDAVDWLWGAQNNSEKQASPTTSAIVRLAIILSGTRLGAFIDNSYRLKSAGKFLLQKLRIIK